MLIAFAIFLFTLVLVIWQPRGIGIGWSASIGALLALALGSVAPGDIPTVWNIVWNATATFIAVIVISLLLDEAGFFEWAALHVARWAGGDGRRLFAFCVAKALAGLGARIFEYSPALEVQYGERIRVRTAKGSVTANKLLWACDSFLNRLEPELHRTTINTYAFQMMTEPLPDELIQRISPIRGAYSDIRPVIDYYRVTNENRLLFGAATPFVERIPGDLKAWNRKLMLKIFPYLEHIRIDLAWGGPMACSANLFPQIGSLSGRPNAFFVQGYSGFGVTPSHIVCKVLAEGMSEGSARYDLLSSVRRIPIHGKDHFRPLLLSAGKTWHQLSGYWNGRR
ncbi:ArsB/NhaD family transporter [Pseudomonas aeruginosa]|uniref:ArsB/NhaD family transporter n=1 Tax=Pseudomonas aeruginosa TaxID=287 RepID=UPI003458BB33